MTTAKRSQGIIHWANTAIRKSPARSERPKREKSSKRATRRFRSSGEDREKSEVVGWMKHLPISREEKEKHGGEGAGGSKSRSASSNKGMGC